MELSGLAAVILVLAIGVMFSLPLRPVHGAGVDLPKVHRPQAVVHAGREDAITIAVLRDGKTFFREDFADFDSLATKIGEAVSNGSERRVYIKADARVRFAIIKRLLSAVREARIDHVTFLTETIKPKSPG
jgi:biopolymer transport protein ExbD